MSADKKRPSVDPKSFELAEHFLPTDAPEDLKWDLANQIQLCVEDFCSDLDQEPEEEEREPDSFRTLGISERDFLP